MSFQKHENNKKKVALIGCGLIGQSWAINFLNAGFSVSLFDPMEGVIENAKEKIIAKLSDLQDHGLFNNCLLYTSPSPRDRQKSRMPSSA